MSVTSAQGRSGPHARHPAQDRTGLASRGHVVAREHLVRVLDAPVALVTAPAGYGKSHLATVLAAQFEGAVLALSCTPAVTTPEELAEHLVRLAQQGGWPVQPSPGGPHATLGELMATLRRSPVLLVLDDAHFLDRAAAALVGDIAGALPNHVRLLVLARHLGSGWARVRASAGAAHLEQRQLAFTTAETAAVAQALGRPLSQRQVLAVHEHTGGWPALAVLTVLRTDELAPLPPGGGDLDDLVEIAMSRLSVADRTAVVHLAHLGTAEDGLLAELAAPGLTQRALLAGLPLAQDLQGQWRLPGPVSDHLAARSRLPPAVASVAVTWWLAHGGAPERAVTLALHCADPGQLTELLAGASLDQLRIVPVSDLLQVLELAASTSDTSTNAGEGADTSTSDQLVALLVRAAQAAESSVGYAPRSRLLELAAEHAGHASALTVRALHAEQAMDLSRDMLTDAALALASSALAGCAPVEVATRARATLGLGMLASRQTDEPSLVLAERLFGEAAELSREAGERTWEARARRALASLVHLVRGHHDAALAEIDQALDLVRPIPRVRVTWLSFRAEILSDAGRFAESAATVSEMFAEATSLSDRRLLGYGHWERARLAAVRGDAAATLTELHAVEQNRGDWWGEFTGAYFLCDAASFAAMVDEPAAAKAYLARATERADELGSSLWMAQAAVWARHGSAREALRVLAMAQASVGEPDGLEPREAWRIELLGAWAGLREGSTEAGTHAAAAFDAAGALGIGDLPMRREPDLAGRLVGLAANAGSRTAQTLQRAGVLVQLEVMGPVTVLVGGLAHPLTHGRPGEIVALLSASGGRLSAEAATEWLWPDGEPTGGPQRLRTVLARLRRATADWGLPGDLVERNGAHLALAPWLRVDAAEFGALARQAVAGHDLGAARSVLSRWRGDPWSEHLDAEWAQRPRRMLVAARIALLDLLLVDAVEREDLDTALAHAEELIEADHDNEERYLLPARLLIEAGRISRAAAYLQRGRQAMIALGVATSPAAQRLLQRVRSST